MASVHAVKLTDLQEVISTLCKTVESGYGPSFQHTVISTSTGKILITNHGTEILGSYNIKHPVAQYAISSVVSHKKCAGDDSKTFVILLNALFMKSAKHVVDMQERMKLFNEISFILSELISLLVGTMDRFCIKLHASKVSPQVENLLQSLTLGILNSHLQEHDSLHMSEVFARFLQSNRVIESANVDDSTRINLLCKYDKLLIIKHPGRILSSSSVLPGFLVSRGFVSSQNSFNSSFYKEQINFILVACSIDSACDDYQNVELLIPDLKDETSLNKLLSDKTVRTKKFFQHLKNLSVNMVITACKLSVLEKTLCSQHNIAAIHAVPEEELTFLCTMFDITVLSDISEKLNVGVLNKCQQIVLGTQEYINLVPASPSPPSSLIITGPTESISHQVFGLLADSLKVIRSTLTSGEFPSNIFSNSDAPSSDEATLGKPSPTYKSTAKSNKTFGVKSKRHEKCRYWCPQALLPGSQPNKIGEDMRKSHGEYLYLIPVGGAFELSLSHVINNYLSTQPVGALGTTALSILSESLLAVPHLLHTNAYYASKPRWLETLSVARHMMKDGQTVSINATEGTATISRSDMTHSFSSKCQLIINVLTVFRQLLQLDHIL